MRARCLTLLAAGALTPGALAQEAINTPAATQPGAGRFVSRTQLVIREFGDGPSDNDRSGRDIAARTIAIVGLTGSLSLEARTIALVRRDFDEDANSSHWGESELTVKWRFWQRDLGPVDTMRISLLAGLELPTGTGGESSHSFDPTIGAVFTGIFGRHGINQAVRWKCTTGDLDAPTYAGDSLADAFLLDTAYLYRLLPAQYTADTEGSWYAVLELNTALETNADTEILIGPGILYEGRRIALEAAIQLPLYQDLDERPETQWALTLGIRFLF
jgi:hypothetical protein